MAGYEELNNRLINDMMSLRPLSGSFLSLQFVLFYFSSLSSFLLSFFLLFTSYTPRGYSNKHRLDTRDAS
ncbi:hypothetical protein BDV39DRAFT_167785 [Aspergillus sergii]|uniref:Uncharacterized protein n=1 Tax=Aspergillus sergii TaxID=1034303 RepID=A0A5N6XF74_9EURO|nr:hypothetical protein BDV39DRAFT_167785 [Aspergillus sergii]